MGTPVAMGFAAVTAVFEVSPPVTYTFDPLFIVGTKEITALLIISIMFWLFSEHNQLFFVCTGMLCGVVGL